MDDSERNDVGDLDWFMLQKYARNTRVGQQRLGIAEAQYVKELKKQAKLLYAKYVPSDIEAQDQVKSQSKRRVTDAEKRKREEYRESKGQELLIKFGDNDPKQWEGVGKIWNGTKNKGKYGIRVIVESQL